MREHQKEGYKDGERSRGKDVWRVAVVQPYNKLSFESDVIADIFP